MTIFLLIIGCKTLSPSPTATSTINPTVTDTQVQLPTIEPTVLSPTEIITETPLSDFQTITVQNVNSLTLMNSITLPSQVSIKWSLDQQSIILSSFQGFRIYSYPELNLLFEFNSQPDEMLVDVSPNGATYVLTLNQSSLLVKNWQTNESHTIQTNINFMAGDISPDGTKIILTQQDEWAGPIFDLASGNHITTLTGFETAAPVYSIVFGEDGEQAIWHARATIRLSNIANNTIKDPIFHEDFLTSYTLSPNGVILATSTLGTKDNSIVPLVFFYSAESGEMSGSLEIPSPASSLDFSPNNQLLVASTGNLVTFINTSVISQVHQFEGDPERVTDAKFSPHGDVLAVSGDNLSVSFYAVPAP
ncbi:MAG: hypothetical protein CVU46_00125 [Chloroflexi bacterium HGW-Chloroflexi-8]|nr:MAG: hypothetical protein CVU46_00125 [Chloroflexi bacterium HGW-Chloroflexi-8]